MEHIYITAGVVAFIFFIYRFIEMRFIEQESKPLKILIKDMLLVFICGLIAFFIIDQLTPVLQEGNGNLIKPAGAFTDNPNF